MKKNKCFENYPFRFVLLANLFQSIIYLIGAFIISKLGSIWLTTYLLFIILLEIRLLRKSCVHCYYYGKLCFSGKGILCSLFFKKGNHQEFIKDKIQIKDILPDFLVSLIPSTVGIFFLIKSFNLWLLVLVISLIFLAFMGTGFIRSSLACKYCKQRINGCPAEQLFNKTTN